MVLAETLVGDLGSPAPDFSLPAVDGKVWTLAAIRGKNGLLVMFIQQHRHYVQRSYRLSGGFVRQYAPRRRPV